MSSNETVVTVHYERKLSDRNYGSEGLSISLSWTVADSEVTTEYLLDRSHYVRTTVLSFLAGSTNLAVAATASHEVNPPDPRGEAWGNSNASSEERAIRSGGDLEDVPF